MAKKPSSKPGDTPEPAEIPPDQAPSELPRMARKSAKKDRTKVVRLSLDLSREFDFRLDSLAKIKGKHKSAFALYLIEQGLRGYKADAALRNVFAEITSQTGEAA